MKYYTSVLKKISIFSLITSMSLASINASESNIPKFSEFENLTPEAYIVKALPEFSSEQHEKITQIFKKIVAIGSTPIAEDNDKISPNNLEKIMLESGYSFPPISTIQGPFLYLCGQPIIKNIMDLGSGNGADSVMTLSTGKQIISVDIHQNQLNTLKHTIQTIFSDDEDKINKFKPFKYNFAQKNVPEKWRDGFDLININKVFHFLNSQETEHMLKSVYNLVKLEGYVCITVATPVTDSFEGIEFDKQKNSKNPTPGLIFYDTSRSLKDPSNSVRKVIPHEQVRLEHPALVSPGQKIEFLKNMRTTLVLRQGRHFHTLETLTPYLTNFVILDSYITKYDPEDWFLSVLIQKPKIFDK